MILLSAVAVLLAGAVLSLALARRPRASLALSSLAVLVGSSLAVAAAAQALGGVSAPAWSVQWALPLGTASLSMDGLSAWFVLTIGVVSAAVAIYCPRYMAAEIAHGSPHVFGAMLCVLVATMLLLVCANDAVLFLLAWELMSLAAFFLVIYEHRRPEVRRGAWMYLVATHLGTALFVLPLFGLLVARTGGSLSFASFASAAASADPHWLTLVFFLGLVGFGTKAGFMPMHVWLPSAHPAAPTPVSALLSGVVIKTGIYGILRLLTWLPPLPSGCGMALLLAGAVSGVMGVLYALAQHDLKRLLAYHSVENIGIIALGIGIGMLGQRAGHPALSAIGYAGALLHVLNHAVFKGLLFLSAGAVIQATGTGHIDRLGGLARRTPINALLFLIAAVSICGLPPFNGFISEWLIYGALFRGAFALSGHSAAAAVVALTSLAVMGGLALACFAKVFGVVFLGETRDASLSARATPAAMAIGMGILATLCILLGIVPAVPLSLSGPGASVLVPGGPADLDMALRAVLAPAGSLTLMAALLIIISLALWLILRLLPATRNQVLASAPAPATWGCGYPFPTPRMQYTSSSFAWSLVSAFRGFLWPRRHLHAPVGPFPAPASLATHTDDAAEVDLFGPLFRATSRLAGMIRNLSWSGQPVVQGASPDVDQPAGPALTTFRRAVRAIRRGSIQICLTYIVLCLLIVFVIEAIAEPGGPENPPPLGPASTPATMPATADGGAQP